MPSGSESNYTQTLTMRHLMITSISTHKGTGLAALALPHSIVTQCLHNGPSIGARKRRTVSFNYQTPMLWCVVVKTCHKQRVAIEFQKCGLPHWAKASDPLSPFLFIIAMEALHVTLEDAKLKNIFEGVKVGSNNIDISYLQFADDALIMEKWSIDNAKNLCRILRCFHLAFGLKVNFLKSKLFGIEVSDIELNTFAYTLFCEPSKLPCVYLGLPIEANINKSNNWKPIIDKFHNRLTSWKAKSLSPGGRLTLLKSVLGALGTYYFLFSKQL
ncbi:putative RNA-directed DNA polymerase, eukaryota, reverse transcriptase zinc-binding domain protein [Tanacetum coccineum]